MLVEFERAPPVDGRQREGALVTAVRIGDVGREFGDGVYVDCPLTLASALDELEDACPNGGLAGAALDRLFGIRRRTFAELVEDIWSAYRFGSSRMRDYLLARRAAPLPHVWCGVSVEDRSAVERVRHLRQSPAAVRFLSVEPLLGPVADRLDLDGVDWVIVGGESGPRARPMDAAWARGVRDLCARAGVPFFFKQWGGRTPKAGGRLLDGRLHDAMPACWSAP